MLAIFVHASTVFSSPSWASVACWQQQTGSNANRRLPKETLPWAAVALHLMTFLSLLSREITHRKWSSDLFVLVHVWQQVLAVKRMWTVHHRKARRPVNEARCWRFEDKRNQSRRSSGFLSSLSTAASSCQWILKITVTGKRSEWAFALRVNG